MLRSESEINRACRQLRLFNEMGPTGSISISECIAKSVEILRWVLGEDNPFGEMIAGCRSIDNLDRMIKAGEN